MFNNEEYVYGRKEKVQISLNALKITKKPGSRPYAVVTLLPPPELNEEPRVLGKTEIIENSPSPKWTTTFQVDFFMGELNRINVGIYNDIRNKNTKKEGNDQSTNKPVYGSAVFDIHEVLGSRGNVKAKRLQKGGTVFVRITKAPEKDEGIFHLQLRGIQLKNVDGFFGKFGKSDPFFELSGPITGASGDHTWQPVYRSKCIMDNLNPQWDALSIPINHLCCTACLENKNVFDAPILVSVYDWEKSGKHQSMGNFQTSIHGLLAATTKDADGIDPTDVNAAKAFTIIHKNKDYGKIVVTRAEVDKSQVSVTDKSIPILVRKVSQEIEDIDVSTHASTNTEVFGGVQMTIPEGGRPGFVDYISGGCELSMTVAIDFTSSNGNPRQPGTLHYAFKDSTEDFNDYEKAIVAVGSVIERFDSKKKFHVLGFGAKIHGVLRNCFQVGTEAEVDGIRGILEAYQSIFHSHDSFAMSGPADFAEVVDYAAAQARAKADVRQRIGKQSYNILLLLTHGDITDIQPTIESLRNASDAPLSIVVVGIGKEGTDFSAMQFLDDFQRYHHFRGGGEQGEQGGQGGQGGGGGGGGGVQRDIVQFVEFSKHKDNRGALIRETLDEIPDQLVDYFYSINQIMPSPPISGGSVQLFSVDEYNEQVDLDFSVEFNASGEVETIVFDDTYTARKSDISQCANFHDLVSTASI